MLRAGHPATATVTITNTGNIRKDFFADARLNNQASQELLGSDVNNVSLPLSVSAQPNWLLPPDTSTLDVAAQGTVPITMDVSWAFGDPDVLGTSSGNKRPRPCRHPSSRPGSSSASPTPPARSQPVPPGL